MRQAGCRLELAAATAPDEKGNAAAAKMEVAIEPASRRVRVASRNVLRERAVVLLDEPGWMNAMKRMKEMSEVEPVDDPSTSTLVLKIRPSTTRTATNRTGPGCRCGPAPDHRRASGRARLAQGVIRWTGLPLIPTFQVVTSLDVPLPVIVYLIFHQPLWGAL